MIYEVYDIDSICLSDLQTMLSLSHHDKLDLSLRFDIAEGTYWYCANYHTGQTSEEYRVLCALEYKPSPLHNKPSTEGSMYVYNKLVIENCATITNLLEYNKTQDKYVFCLDLMGLSIEEDTPYYCDSMVELLQLTFERLN